MNKAPITTMVLNSTIVEYDIRSANTSILEFYGMLPKKTLDILNKYPKDKREVTVGLMLQKDKELSKELEKKFTEVMMRFINDNMFDIDYDVLCIKKDAAFIINKTPTITTYGPIEFRPKGRYHTFFNMSPFEFYINDEEVVVKGLQKQAHLHTNGILSLIKDIANLCKSTAYSKAEVYKYLSDLAESYKKKELDFEYYREFNSSSKFKVIIDDHVYMFSDISEEDIPDLDISYNYINIILPLIRLFV